jgi:bacillithiol biosynthesis deacetylase BshB1
MTLTAPTQPVYALAFGAHPDDVELACGATLLKIMDEGQRVAVCDLTGGEMGTLGTAETRRMEAALATERMGYAAREQLDLGDSELFYTKENLREVIRIVRKYQPETVICNPPDERHPDHMKASRLVYDACYYAGLRKIETFDGDLPQAAHRPRHLLYYIQFRQLEPEIIVDVSATFERSRGGVEAFGTQFHRKENSDEPETMINRKEFLPGLEARARALGEQIGAMYGEGFLLPTALGVERFTSVFPARA